MSAETVNQPQPDEAHEVEPYVSPYSHYYQGEYDNGPIQDDRSYTYPEIGRSDMSDLEKALQAEATMAQVRQYAQDMDHMCQGILCGCQQHKAQARNLAKYHRVNAPRDRFEARQIRQGVKRKLDAVIEQGNIFDRKLHEQNGT